jgi:hypothetical protein
MRRGRLNYTPYTPVYTQSYTAQVLRNQAHSQWVYSGVWFCDNFPSAIGASYIELPNHTPLYTLYTQLVQTIGKWALSGFGGAIQPYTAASFARITLNPLVAAVRRHRLATPPCHKSLGMKGLTRWCIVVQGFAETFFAQLKSAAGAGKPYIPCTSLHAAAWVGSACGSSDVGYGDYGDSAPTATAAAAMQSIGAGPNIGPAVPARPAAKKLPARGPRQAPAPSRPQPPWVCDHGSGSSLPTSSCASLGTSRPLGWPPARGPGLFCPVEGLQLCPIKGIM